MSQEFQYKRLAPANRLFQADKQVASHGVPRFASSRMTLDDDVQRQYRRMPIEYFIKSPVRLRSAVCCSLVIHALITIDFESEVKTTYMTRYLNEEYRQIKWDPVSVGKILSQIAAAAERLQQIDDHFEWGDALPFARLQTTSGWVYYFGERRLQTLAWFHALLEELRPMAEKETIDPEDLAIRKGGVGEVVTPILKAALAIEEKLAAAGKDYSAIFRAYNDLMAIHLTAKADLVAPVR